MRNGKKNKTVSQLLIIYFWLIGYSKKIRLIKCNGYEQCYLKYVY